LKSRKGDIRKFDGIDPVSWILQMEQYFDLHGVPLLQKLYIASSYLESDQLLWYKGLCSHKHLVTWSIFMDGMIAHYKDTKSNTFFRETPQQLEEKREKWLRYNFNNKYIKGHKCGEKKLFYIDCVEEEGKDQETSKEEYIHEEPTLEKEEMNLTISCKAL